MAKVKIQGHASGTGVITVTAPNTSTDRTITLPDATGTLLNSDGSAANLTAIPAANITGTLPAISGANLTGISAGKILQVVEANGTTHTSASTTNSTWTDTVVTAAITPASTSNKIFVSYRLAVHFVDSSGSGGYGLRCKRAVSGGSTTDNVPALSTWSSGNVHTIFYMETNTGGDFNMMSTVTGVDSPGASTAVTYTVGIAPYNVTTTLEAGGQYSGRWSMVLMEIEG